jgi:hypothetical protein
MHLDYAQVGAVFAQKGQAPDKEQQSKTDLVSTGAAVGFRRVQGFRGLGFGEQGCGS